MPQVQLDDRIFQIAQQRAAAGGFASVDEYLADVISHDIDDQNNIEHLFTPERLAHIARADAEIDAGNSYTIDEVKLELAEQREQWLRENPH